MDFNDVAADIQRREDAQFHANVEKLAADAEDIRMTLMRSYRTRELIASGAMIVFVLIGALGFGWYLLYEGWAEMAITSMLVAVFAPMLADFWAEAPLKHYREDYKKRFMPKLAHELGGFKFYPTRGISRKLIQKTGVLPAHETYSAEDCFMGRYKGVKVIFSEARLYEGKRKKNPVFDGLFVLLETPEESIHGHSILTTDNAMIGHYASKRWKNLSPLPMRHGAGLPVDFKLFSTKQHHGEILDNDRLLKELADTSQIFDLAPVTLVAFGKKYVFFMIPYAHNMFEPSNIHMPIQTKQQAIMCKREVEQVLEIIDVCDAFRSPEQPSER